MVSAHQGVPISRSMAGTQNFHLFGLVTFSEIAGLKDWYCPAMLWPFESQMLPNWFHAGVGTL